MAGFGRVGLAAASAVSAVTAAIATRAAWEPQRRVATVDRASRRSIDHAVPRLKCLSAPVPIKCRIATLIQVNAATIDAANRSLKRSARSAGNSPQYTTARIAGRAARILMS